MRKFLTSPIAWLLGAFATPQPLLAAPEPSRPSPRKKKVAKRHHHVGRSKYMPHNGEQEKARRRRQMGRGE